MSEAVEKVGFVGLGRMGTGIAHNILKAGFRLAVYNRTASKAEALVRAGAKLARSPKDAAAADVVVTCLMDDQSVLDLTTGPDGILAGLGQAPTPTGTPTKTPLLSATPTRTATPVPTATQTATATREPSDGGGGGCTVTPSRSGAAWWLLLPVLLLAWTQGRWRRSYELDHLLQRRRSKLLRDRAQINHIERMERR